MSGERERRPLPPYVQAMAHSHDTPVADYVPTCFRCEAERKLVGLRNLVRRASAH